MQNFIQIKIENSEDFKKEIIRGVVDQIKDLGLYNQPKEKEENLTDLISRTDTAKILNISLVKLWEITKNKQIPVYKIGGKVLYKRNEINDFINLQSRL